MLLHHLTWREVEGYLDRSRGIIMPIGSTEQHGPNGLIGTDAICAEHVARAVGEAADALVAPTIAVGMAQHHMAFAGSMTLRPSTLIGVIRDMVSSLARHGFEAFFFINGHGGNASTINAAFQEIYAEVSLGPRAQAPTVRCTFRNWWTNDQVRALAKGLYGDKEGAHATPSEVALTQHVLPDTIKHAEIREAAAPWGHFTDAEDYRRRYPDGRIGSDPSLATPEDGARLLEKAVAALAADYQAFVKNGRN